MININIEKPTNNYKNKTISKIQSIKNKINFGGDDNFVLNAGVIVFLLLLHLIVILLSIIMFLDLILVKYRKISCDITNEFTLMLYVLFNAVICILLFLQAENKGKDLGFIITLYRLYAVIAMLSPLLYAAKYFPSYGCLTVNNNNYNIYFFVHILVISMIFFTYNIKIRKNILKSTEFLSQFKE